MVVAQPCIVHQQPHLQALQPGAQARERGLVGLGEVGGNKARLHAKPLAQLGRAGLQLALGARDQHQVEAWAGGGGTRVCPRAGASLATRPEPPPARPRPLAPARSPPPLTRARQLLAVGLADAVGGPRHHRPAPIEAQVAAGAQEVDPHKGGGAHHSPRCAHRQRQEARRADQRARRGLLQRVERALQLGQQHGEVQRDRSHRRARRVQAGGGGIGGGGRANERGFSLCS